MAAHVGPPRRAAGQRMLCGDRPDNQSFCSVVVVVVEVSPGIGAAVSFAAATVGSDTTGSIISPASYNGVVGVRPTVALISRRGIVPISATQDTAGPMARNVTDAAILLTALAV